MDFGCGSGNFLRSVHSATSSAFGVELQRSCNEALNRDGIPCFSDISQIPSSIDTICMFHGLEHLPDPLKVLCELSGILGFSEGKLTCKVSIPNDFLISQLQCESFINFILWSQHLVLHTNDSLREFLNETLLVEDSTTGVSDSRDVAVQRGQSSDVIQRRKAQRTLRVACFFDTADLSMAYQSGLTAQDSTETRVAIARVGSKS